LSTIIEEVFSRKIINSRGNPTIEVDINTIDGFGRASAPSGASTGKAEVTPFPKNGVDEAIKKIEDVIAPEIIGLYADEQKEIDILLHELDGTDDFSEIGGNTAYAISLAVADAAASSYGLPLFQYLGGALACELPYPLGNVIGGGKHAFGKATDIQEFLVLPLGVSTFSQAVETNAEIHRKIKNILKGIDPNFTGGKGDEGAWAPNISNEDALVTVYDICQKTSEETGINCRPGMDIAASSIWNSKKQCYIYTTDRKKYDAGEQIEFVKSLIERYNLAYVEDPVHEDDFEGFKELTTKVHDCLICGDDLFVTNIDRLKQGIKMGAGNSIIIKMNQVGTLTDTWNTTKLAKENKIVPILSHRSGETSSNHASHLAISFNTPIIKTGVVGGERISKLNELIRIEEMLGEHARMPKISIKGANRLV
jgi:enolase